MQTHTTYTDLPPAARGSVLALGNFDGLHRGHQAVIARARAIADDLSAPLAIGLFRPHPRRVFRPDDSPFRLMSAELRAELLPRLGADHLFEIPFDATLREMDDATFVETVLHRGLGIAHVVVGEDYGFGKNRCGDVESLTRLGAERGIGTTALSPVGLHALYGKYGSTQIREALRAGDVFHAAHMLGRPWIVDGPVERGAQRGRTLDFPTANLAFADRVRPLGGVYVVEVEVDGRWHGGVANTGTRPTVSGEEARVEAHIFDFDADLYGQRIKVAFRSFIREERKFDGLGDLKAQIEKDAAGARAVLGSYSAYPRLRGDPAR